MSRGSIPVAARYLRQSIVSDMKRRREKIVSRMTHLNRVLRLVGGGKALTVVQERQLADNCREVLRAYRDAAAARGTNDKSVRRLRATVRKALLYIGGDPDRVRFSLKDYDHLTYGPFLGVSDEGSAAAAVREAVYRSPKMQVLRRISPLELGVALDAERLGAVGEVVVGPEEYADIWLECVGRVLMTTNVSTRVNVRYFKRFPVVTISEGDPQSTLAAAEQQIASALSPYQRTPDGKPRPITVFVEFEPQSRHTRTKKLKILSDLAQRVAQGDFATPGIHQVGLCVRTGRGPQGRDEALSAIDLACAAKVKEVMVIGVVREEADEIVSLPGLLQYFVPGLLGPVLRHAKACRIRVRAGNTTDPATIARNIWSMLNTARSMGFHLGKYGAFPLTFEDCTAVVREVQGWFANWSAAPVFFVDQGIVSSERVDVRRDVGRGLEQWLRMVAQNGVPVVLIDTIEKSKGWRLLRIGRDPKGFLGPRQIARLDHLARKLGVKVLWAGGITLPEVYELGKLGVFGIYVTSSTAVSQAVSGVYKFDPLLASVKEPTYEGVLRTKLLLEAGFLVSHLKDKDLAGGLDGNAKSYLTALQTNDAVDVRSKQRALMMSTIEGWRRHFKTHAACMADHALRSASKRNVKERAGVIDT